MRILFPGLVLAGCAVANSAAAECVTINGPAQDGARVVCSDIDLDGFNQDLLIGGNLDDIDLSVRFGAVLTNAVDERTVQLDDGATIVNRGSILSTGGEDAIEIDNDGFIYNIGLIDGADEAIQTGEDATIINGASGTITADDKGITTDEVGLTVLNRGVIDTVDEAIEGGDDALIENGGTGSIFSLEDDAIQIGFGGVYNAPNASITSEGGDGIDIDAGLIINRGLISTTASGEAAIDIDEGDGDVIVVNSGTLSGAFGVLTDGGNTGSQIIENSGTISAFDGFALALGDGQDALILQRGSELVGDADFGAGDDELYVMNRNLSFSAGSLLDGGEGFDTVFLAGFEADLLTTALYDSGVFTFGMARNAVDWTVNLTNWESFVFSDGSEISAADLAATLAPVPLPAGGVLLISALGLMALRRRQG